MFTPSEAFCFLKIGQSRPFFFIFLFNTLSEPIQYKMLLMIELEPRISSIRSDRSAN